MTLRATKIITPMSKNGCSQTPAHKVDPFCSLVLLFQVTYQYNHHHKRRRVHHGGDILCYTSPSQPISGAVSKSLAQDAWPIGRTPSQGCWCAALRAGS